MHGVNTFVRFVNTVGFTEDLPYSEDIFLVGVRMGLHGFPGHFVDFYILFQPS